MAGKMASRPCIFRGQEYIVSMTTEDNETLMVEVEDRLSADQWRGTFDASYLEDLTHKTGNYKQFQIFVNMLESAIAQNSDSVTLDLLTYSDLETLRNQKSTIGSKNIPRAPRNTSLSSKRYLILTYTVEFDRIHYPLPLPYMGKPDPRALQDTIRELRKEIQSLRQHGSKDYRGKEVEKLKCECERLREEKAQLEAAFVDFRHEVQQTTVGHAVKEVRVLKEMVKNLEEDLMSERTKHQRATTRRSQEHRQMLGELDEARTNERNLRARVKSLTNELAMYKRRGSNCRTASFSGSTQRRGASQQNSILSNGLSSRENSFSRDNSHVSRNSSYLSHRSNDRSRERSRERSLSRGRSTDRPAYLRDRSKERTVPSYLKDRPTSRERSLSRERGRDRSRDSVSSGRGRGRSPAGTGITYPRFDPTAYIKDKQRKTEANSKRRGRPPRLSSNERKARTSIGDRRPRSRNSSVGSLRSRTSSLESLSDVGAASDTSNGRIRRSTKTVKPLNAWSSPDVSFTSRSSSSKPASKTVRKNNILSSTPETQRTRSKTKIKEQAPSDGVDSDYFDRSSEIGEIDARLNRLQQFMQNNLC